MDENRNVWRQFYEKSLKRPHSQRTEYSIALNESSCHVAIDCGCGAGSDIAYLISQGYQVHGFDLNPDCIAICNERFALDELVKISQASFENFAYPKSGAIIANSSLFFAEPTSFKKTWRSMISNLAIGGVFVGDFMGKHDSWASGYRSCTAPLTEQQVADLFLNFEIIKFHERNEFGKTSLGKTKKWHTYSVVAVKRA